MTALADAMDTALQDLPNVSENAFKSVMRVLAATVCVITSRHDGETNGMTATAICSVSASPPTILIVVNRENHSHALIRDGGCFALNILSADQDWLAMKFATRAPLPFASVAVNDGMTGCPIIDGCGAVLECVLASSFDAATHTIFIGRVVACQQASMPPLLYREGQFGTMA